MSLHAIRKDLVYLVASLPMAMLLVQLKIMSLLSRVGISLNLTTTWFPGFQAVWHYMRLARQKDWPLWPAVTYLSLFAAFIVAGVVWISL